MAYILTTAPPASLAGRRQALLKQGAAMAVALVHLPCAMAMGAGAPFAPPARVAVPVSAAMPAAAASAAMSALPSVDGATSAMPALDSSADTGLRGLQLGAHPRALIDGQWVALGAEVRGARLSELRIDRVVLRHADGRLEQLLLSPQIEMLSRTAHNGVQPPIQNAPPIARRAPLPVVASSVAPRPARLVSESP